MIQYRKWPALYTKETKSKRSIWRTRWHIVDAETGLCLPCCTRPGWKACGYHRRKDAKAVVFELSESAALAGISE